jgi:hypothetical protein
MPSHYLQNLNQQTTKTNTPDPVRSNPIIAAAMDAAAMHVTKTEIAARKQEDITAETLEASGIIQTGITDVAKDKAIIAGYAGLAEFKAQNARIATYEEAGGIEFQKELMQALGAAGKELIQANNEFETVQNREVTGVIDYFRKANEVNRAFFRAENAEDRRNDIAENISLINSSQESIARALVTTKETVNKGVIDAGSSILATEAEVSAAKARLDSLGANATALRAGMAADATALNAKFDVVRFENEAINQEAREEAHVLTVASANRQAQAWIEGAPARATALELQRESLADIQDPVRKQLVAAQRLEDVEQLEADNRRMTIYTANVQAGQSVTGLPIEDADTIVAQGMEAKTAGERLRYETLRNIGLREKAAFGYTPGEALEVISIVRANPKVSAVRLLMEGNRDYIASKVAAKETIPKDADPLRKTEFNAFIAKEYAIHAANIKSGDESNPYQAAPMAVLAEYTAVKESSLYKTVLEPMAMKEFDAKSIYKATLAGISAKTISIEKAAIGLETLFKTAALHNNETKLFQRAGLPMQESYTTEIIDPSVIPVGAIGAATGAALATAALTTAAVVTAPATALVTATVLGASTLLGAGITALDPTPYPLIDSTKREEVMHALSTLIAAEAKIGDLF